MVAASFQRVRLHFLLVYLDCSLNFQPDQQVLHRFYCVPDSDESGLRFLGLKTGSSDSGKLGVSLLVALVLVLDVRAAPRWLGSHKNLIRFGGLTYDYFAALI